ncbi:MAG: dTMP kinase [Chloroflexi bacterium]|nr:dTMP kinase [Chloroflexota bacterium]
MFITFEGPEGAGKTTHAALLAQRLRAAGRSCVQVREPGGTPLGDRIRVLLLQGDLAIGTRGEALLYCAARAQVIDEAICPALERGEIVVADRYADSTLAYQGYGRGLDLASLAQVLAFATRGLAPDLTVLLDLPVAEGLERKRRLPPEEWNRFEAEELAYHQRVREGYLALAAAEPWRWVVLDARQPVAALADAIWGCVERCLQQAHGSGGGRA